MSIDLTYPAVQQLFKKWVATGRNESASFLIWYLVNYYRLDEIEAVDSVCDESYDKGVDGIYVNENAGTIDILQSKIRQNSTALIGDTTLKEFHGTLAQFASKESVATLLTSQIAPALKRLIEDLKIKQKIGSYQVRGVFVCNADLDTTGKDYLEHTPDITFIGKSELTTAYIPDNRTDPVQIEIELDISNHSLSEYIVDIDTSCVIVPIKAFDLLKLQGISDQSLFIHNVRGQLGNTNVNKEIQASIKDQKMHKLFPLFHNGITIICNNMVVTTDTLKISEYFVVNGCQSLSTLNKNSKNVSSDLYVLAKIIKMDVKSELSEIVTHYSNNQNGVKARDFKANSPHQVRLQNEFATNYRGHYAFQIKRGEEIISENIISNEEAGLYLIAFDLKQPWTTHRKYEVFDDKYNEIFNRPEVSADRILMCHLIMERISATSNQIENELLAKYRLTSFFLLYVIRNILDQDDLGKDMIRNPTNYVRIPAIRSSFISLIDRILSDVYADFNSEVTEMKLTEHFDYRGAMRDETWTSKMNAEIVKSHQKMVNRKSILSVSKDWEDITKSEAA